MPISHFHDLAAAIVVAGLAVSTNVEAACASNSQTDPGACTDVKTTLLYVDGTDAYVGVNSSVSSLTCVPPGGSLLKLPGTLPNFKVIYSTLLAAQLSSRNVNIRLLPGTSECTITYVTMP
ncbi:hypothetical protein [Ideonella paludis]|uniref:Secreted protein n=1 Tax=Ideonella paludis TaxID=1233411 RepID=A0ABS5DVH0_9BURK|nr:hypothetical protein [Ideonella paludis]MBQ0935089.1 hypothetical protein [Ideonella paludis]